MSRTEGRRILADLPTTRSDCAPPIPLAVMAQRAEETAAEIVEAESRLERLQRELRWWEEAAWMLEDSDA